MTRFSLLLLTIIFLTACSEQPVADQQTEPQPETRPVIEMTTDKGTIVFELYNETHKHRDNFLKLAEEGAFDSLLFHRVINTFVVQGGDPDSKYAQPGDTLGNGDLDYLVDAEFHPDLFHKRGALGAARDGNLERASSAMQFYFVQRKECNDSLLEVGENRINQWLAENHIKHQPEHKELADALRQAELDEDWDLWGSYNDSIKVLAEQLENFERYTIPDAHREVYKAQGGVPHLDQNYTVFGEIIEGLDVMDSIAVVETDGNDRPVEDVRIIGLRIR